MLLLKTATKVSNENMSLVKSSIKTEDLDVIGRIISFGNMLSFFAKTQSKREKEAGFYFGVLTQF